MGDEMDPATPGLGAGGKMCTSTAGVLGSRGKLDIGTAGQWRGGGTIFTSSARALTAGLVCSKCWACGCRLSMDILSSSIWNAGVQSAAWQLISLTKLACEDVAWSGGGKMIPCTARVWGCVSNNVLNRSVSNPGWKQHRTRCLLTGKILQH